MNNSTRTILGGLVLTLLGLALLVLALVVFTPPTPAVVWASFGAMLVAIVAMVLTTLFSLQEGHKGPQVFVFPIMAWQFLGYHALVAVLAVGLDFLEVWSAPWGLVLIVHVIILGVYTLLLLGTAAGSEEIERTQEVVGGKVSAWRTLVTEVAVLQGRVSADNPQCQAARKALDTLHDAFRYSDPMSNPALASLEAGLRSALSDLCPAVDAGRWEEVISKCQQLQIRVQERNVRVKALK